MARFVPFVWASEEATRTFWRLGTAIVGARSCWRCSCWADWSRRRRERCVAAGAARSAGSGAAGRIHRGAVAARQTGVGDGGRAVEDSASASRHRRPRPCRSSVTFDPALRLVKLTPTVLPVVPLVSWPLAVPVTATVEAAAVGRHAGRQNVGQVHVEGGGVARVGEGVRVAHRIASVTGGRGNFRGVQDCLGQRQLRFHHGYGGRRCRCCRTAGRR